MTPSRNKKIAKLKDELYSLQWEKHDVYASKMDPDMQAIYANDIDYKVYCIQKEIENIEHEEAMFPLRLMLAAFIIFALVLVLYRISH